MIESPSWRHATAACARLLALPAACAAAWLRRPLPCCALVLTARAPPLSHLLPWCPRLEMITPKEYVGSIMELAQTRRGEYVDMQVG